MRDLAILGAGGFAREVTLLVEEINRSADAEWNILGYLDEDGTKWGKRYRNYSVLGGLDVLKRLPENTYVICAVGDPVSKKIIIEKASDFRKTFATLIHPDLYISKDVTIGEGVIINKGCKLTVNISISNHVSINPGCGVGHDSEIKEFSTLMWDTNISGSVSIGKGCLIGTKATILQGKSIGDWSTIGAGALVTKDIPANCVAIGVPAKIRL